MGPLGIAEWQRPRALGGDFSGKYLKAEQLSLGERIER